MGLTIALVGLLTGCQQWVSGGFDASGSADNAADTQITTADVAGLHVEWTAGTGAWSRPPEPVASGNTVVEVGDNAAEVMAFSVDGAGCTGTPKTCQPLWVAHGIQFEQPLVHDGRVYVSDDGTGRLNVFDLAGSAGCTGSAPAVCTPLWQGATPGTTPIAASDGLIYVGDSYHSAVVAYDPDGGTCSGSPLVCQPVATYPTYLNGQITALVADSTRYYALVTVQSNLSVPLAPPIVVSTQYLLGVQFGQPESVWVDHLPTGGYANPGGGLMAVDGHVYVAGAGDNYPLPPPYTSITGTDELAAFNPDGTALWSSTGLLPPLAATPTAIYASTPAGDAASVVACDPTTGCGPTGTSRLRTYPMPDTKAASSLLLDDGVVVVGDGGPDVRAFDAGATGCTGAPATCPTLADLSVASGVTALSATNGRLYAMSGNAASWNLYSLVPAGP